MEPKDESFSHKDNNFDSYLISIFFCNSKESYSTFIEKGKDTYKLASEKHCFYFNYA